jgi:zinc finger protein 423
MDILKNHERLHTGERKYKCPLCPKTYAHLGILKKHSYFHSGERPVHCDVCNKGFYQKCALDIHMNIHKKQWIAQGMQGITLTSYKQTKKENSTTKRPSEFDDYSADSSGYS